MSELAASIGAVPKTAPLVIDEAFDTLDNSGVEALINLACEIANERQVFLVSHADPSAPLGPIVRRISL
jgi:ABC-type molybdenum transport system ATPase subunit/photorepair protein PhrA